MKKEEIVRVAERALKQHYWDFPVLFPPVELGEILSVLGVTCLSWPVKASTYNRSKKRILLSGKEELFSNREFIVARFLGHHILHKNINENTLEFNSVLNTNGREEKEAVIFANELLMPTKVVEAYMKTPRGLSEVASAFRVPRHIAENRLRELGYGAA